MTRNYALNAKWSRDLPRKSENAAVLATLSAPEFCFSVKTTAPNAKGSEAPKGAAVHGHTSGCDRVLKRRTLAFRRFTAALASNPKVG
jgi:hypothetical protein